MPKKRGVMEGRLAPCPNAPHCVSSDTEDPDRRVAPLRFEGSSDRAWEAAVRTVESLPRVRIITRTDDYLHAECRSALFGFVDDLELHVRPAEGVIAVRSSSRVGYYDFGVNRRRVESLRTTLREEGVVE